MPPARSLSRWAWPLAVLGALAAGTPASSIAQREARGRSDAIEDATLVFTNATADGAPLVEAPRLSVGFGGAMREAVVDTGSTGVVVSASAIPANDRLPTLGPGTVTYTSSGRIMTGRWVVTPVTIAGRAGRVVTRPIPVLAVDAIDCIATARRCTPERNPGHVAMLGIGFGREHDRQPGGTPDRNPMLNVARPAALASSYLITRREIRLGQSGQGFVLVKLARDVAHGDWSAPGGCITVGGGEPSCGTVLVDTGITGMFLTVPADRLPLGGGGSTMPEGTSISIDLVPGDTGGRGYTVRVGDLRDPAAPSSITLAGIGRRPTFVNTGARLLNRFDYFYDAAAGLVGYRLVGR